MQDLVVAHDITSYECQADHLMRPEYFMHACQEIAELHASENGCGYNWGMQNRTIWVEVQGDFLFLRRPSWKDTVIIRTNTGRLSALQAGRFVEMTDREGHILAQADLNWVLIDVKSRRPVPFKRVGLELDDSCPLLIATPMPDFPDRPDTPAAASSDFIAPKRDVDFNAHINNSAYLTWVLDTLPDDLCPGIAPKRVHIRFRHESHAGEPMHIEHFVNGKLTRHLISCNGTLRAELRLLWE